MSMATLMNLLSVWARLPDPVEPVVDPLAESMVDCNERHAREVRRTLARAKLRRVAPKMEPVRYKSASAALQADWRKVVKDGERVAGDFTRALDRFGRAH